ncbi:MAG: hypothetical protein ACK4VW_04765 [Anaerolineales bacterium]
MPFDVAEYHAFVQLLYQHPEWRAEVRKLVLSEDILALPEIVRQLSVTVKELAEAQKRTDEQLQLLTQRVDALAEAQKRTDEQLQILTQRVDALTQRVDALTQRMDELAEAQKRTELRVDKLAIELEKTRKEVGRLAAAFGSTLEEEAASVVEAVMRRKGYQLLDEALNLQLDGEVDVILPVQTGEGRRVSVIVESKARLGRRDVVAWVERIRSKGWQKRLHAAGYPGPYLLYFYAIRTDLGARDALVEAGVGLLKSEGEVIAPRSEFGE